MTPFSVRLSKQVRDSTPQTGGRSQQKESPEKQSTVIDPTQS